jgi:uncharacterized protein YqeY
MSLTARIESDFLAAYKAREELRVAVLRLVKAALKNRAVELMRPLTDDDAMDVLLKQVKQRQESIEVFGRAGRQDLLEKEQAELDILQTYLPSRLSPEELDAAVAETLAALGASGMKDLGRVMQALTAAFKGRVDGKELSALVRAKLGSNT